MDFLRKNRYTNYNDIKCKEYARHDFEYQCAYCLTKEKITGISYNAFEIDHFVPKTKPYLCEGDVNGYNNLFYSCKVCNGKKSDFYCYDLLNPCADDIYSGDNPLVYIDDDSRVIANNEKGILFINVFKLNSRYHISRRKKSKELLENRKTINELINVVLAKENCTIYDEINQVKEIIEKSDSIEYGLTDKFCDADELLSSLNIEHRFIFEENNIDIVLKNEGVDYYCELIFDDNNEIKDTYEKRINKEKIEAWFNDGREIGVLFFFYKIKKMYFVKLSCIVGNTQELNAINAEKRIFLCDGNLIKK